MRMVNSIDVFLRVDNLYTFKGKNTSGYFSESLSGKVLVDSGPVGASRALFSISLFDFSSCFSELSGAIWYATAVLEGARTYMYWSLP